MIKKRLTIWLFIVSILSYSSVWAMHSHDDMANHEQAISTADSHISNSQHQLDDDHCCHAGAHLLGLLNTQFSEFLPVNHVVETEYGIHLFTYSTSPPQRPPLVNS